MHVVRCDVSDPSRCFFNGHESAMNLALEPFVVGILSFESVLHLLHPFRFVSCGIKGYELEYRLLTLGLPLFLLYRSHARQGQNGMRVIFSNTDELSDHLEGIFAFKTIWLFALTLISFTHRLFYSVLGQYLLMCSGFSDPPTLTELRDYSDALRPAKMAYEPVWRRIKDKTRLFYFKKTSIAASFLPLLLLCFSGLEKFLSLDIDIGTSIYAGILVVYETYKVIYYSVALRSAALRLLSVLRNLGTKARRYTKILLNKVLLLFNRFCHFFILPILRAIHSISKFILERCLIPLARRLGQIMNYILEKIILPFFKALYRLFCFIYKKLLLPIYELLKALFIAIWDYLLFPMLDVLGRILLLLFRRIIFPILDLVSQVFIVLGSVLVEVLKIIGHIIWYVVSFICEILFAILSILF